MNLKMTDAQKTLYYIAENMKMEKKISDEGYEHFQQAIKALEKQSDDCVSRRAVIAIASDSCLDLDNYEDTKEFCDEIRELPPVTPTFPKDATNGDMIKAMFPTMEIEECYKDVNGNPNIYRLYGLSGVAEFGREFWNAPYKRGSENESNN